MYGTTLDPDLRARYARAPLLNRLRFRFALRRYSAACNSRDNLLDRYDCGADLADHISGGKVSAADQKINRAVTRLKAVIDTLPEDLS